MNIWQQLLSLTLALSLVILVGCSTVSSNSPSLNQEMVEPANAQTQLPRLDGTATVEMKLKYGTVIMEIDGVNAPITAGNFVDLVRRGVYTNLSFHRVIREPSPFVAQGGDPLGNGTGSFIDPTTGQPRLIPLEIMPNYDQTKPSSPIYSKTINGAVKLPHRRSAVAMARAQNPDSASSQFYIALADLNFLDGSYAVFGYVTQGMDLVDKIQVGDRIESMKVINLRS